MKQLFTLLTAVFLFASCSKESTTIPIVKRTVLQIVTNTPYATVSLFTSKDARQAYVFDGTGSPTYSIACDISGTATFADINAGYYYWYSYYGCANSVNNPLTQSASVIANDTTKVTDFLAGVGKLTIQNTNSVSSIDIYINSNLITSIAAGYQITFKNQPANTPIIVKAVNKTFGNSQTKYPEISSCGGTATVQFNP